MTILDKLVEKKDLLAYVKYRRQYLKDIQAFEVHKQPDKKKQLVYERFRGRMEELDTLASVIRNNKVKDQSKRLCIATRDDEKRKVK
jgi:hypothetical protein